MLLDLIDDDILFKQLGSQAGPLKQIFRDILGPLDATVSATRQDNATLHEEIDQLRTVLDGTVRHHRTMRQTAAEDGKVHLN